MTRDILDRLADADPSRHLAPDPDETLLARTLEAPGPRQRPRRARRLVLAAGLTGAVAAAAAVLITAAPEPAPLAPPVEVDLAAAAYAKTAPDPRRIQHTFVEVTTTRGEQQERGSIEEWHRGRETHRLERYEDGPALDHVIGADGEMGQIDEAGRYRIVRRSDNADAAEVIARQQQGFIEEFRLRYEQGRLDPAGDVTFNGRPARRYLVTQSGGLSDPPPVRQSYYVDRRTAEPLGLRSEFLGPATPSGGAATTPTRYEQVVRTSEYLAPTDATLADLRTFALPRRRDEEGCIRGPITNGRGSDSARKSNCGGTPGAPVTAVP